MLTDAELRILQDAADGKSYRETAKDLGTSEAVIKNQASALFKELQVANKTNAVAAALRRQLID